MQRPELEEIHDEQSYLRNHNDIDEFKVTSTGAIVNLDTSIALLYHYCQVGYYCIIILSVGVVTDATEQKMFFSAETSQRHVLPAVFPNSRTSTSRMFVGSSAGNNACLFLFLFTLSISVPSQISAQLPCARTC